jgi:hypothetical protein
VRQNSVEGAHTTKASRLLREPTLHFFVLAAAAFLAHRIVVGDPHTIELTPTLKADILRRYQDQLGRPPTSTEAEACVAAWKVDEALYRDAVRQGIDRDDPTVRNLLISILRQRLVLQTRPREPTEAELQEYLEQHRADYETPLLYEHEFVAFPKQDRAAEHERAKYKRLLTAGATPASLGLRSTAANVNRERIAQDFGPEVAEKVQQLPVGNWQELETSDRLLLVRMIRIQGGLPPPAALHQQVLAGFQTAMEQKALDQATQVIVRRYRFEEKSR